MTAATDVDHALSGILAIDKPASMTSHDVVSIVRGALGVRRVGHAGTLDPMATGLLVVLTGPATRLARFLVSDRKTYDATVRFGSETDTCDAEGEPTLTEAVPAILAAEAHAEAALAALVGPHSQTPPVYSAIKIDGRKAYELARAGHDPKLEPRPIEVFSAELLGVQTAPDIEWHVRLEVSKGTYVRALARDLGRSEGTAAHLAALRRTASGLLDVADATSLEELGAASDSDQPVSLFTPALKALSLPHLHVTEDEAGLVAHGNAITPANREETGAQDGEPIAVFDPGGRLLAVYRRQGDSLRAEVVLPGGCA